LLHIVQSLELLLKQLLKEMHPILIYESVDRSFRCPLCAGPMIIVETFPRYNASPFTFRSLTFDSSENHMQLGPQATGFASYRLSVSYKRFLHQPAPSRPPPTEQHRPPCTLTVATPCAFHPAPDRQSRDLSSNTEANPIA